MKTLIKFSGAWNKNNGMCFTGRNVVINYFCFVHIFSRKLAVFAKLNG